MRIGEVADRIAINPKTIRYYESIGLIPEPARTASGYRDFGPDDFERIRFIKSARRLDLSLDEIGEILDFADGQQPPCGHVRGIVSRKAAELDQRIEEMIELRDELIEIEKAVPQNDSAICPLIEHRASG